jgi:hypothetical protein
VKLDRSAGFHLRFYRMFLLLYPPSFRHEYGHLMAQAFSDRLTERGARRTWLLLSGDLWLSVPRQILEASLMDQRWLGAFTALSAVLFMTAMGIGLGSPILLVTLAVTTVGLLAVLSRKASDRPTEYRYYGGTPKALKWWTVLALLLAAVYVLAAVGQLIDDPKATNVGALGIMIGFSGLIVGGLRLRARSKIGGNWMVIFATVPALMFFWVIVPALVGLAIIAGALTEIVRATPQQPLAT